MRTKVCSWITWDYSEKWMLLRAFYLTQCRPDDGQDTETLVELQDEDVDWMTSALCCTWWQRRRRGFLCSPILTAPPSVLCVLGPVITISARPHHEALCPQPTWKPHPLPDGDNAHTSKSRSEQKKVFSFFKSSKAGCDAATETAENPIWICISWCASESFYTCITCDFGF